jgi:PKD repeat protein
VQHPEHTYLAAGAYTVTLTVDNALGSDLVVYSGYIEVLENIELYLPVMLKP